MSHDHVVLAARNHVREMAKATRAIVLRVDRQESEGYAAKIKHLKPEKAALYIMLV